MTPCCMTRPCRLLFRTCEVGPKGKQHPSNRVMNRSKLDDYVGRFRMLRKDKNRDKYPAHARNAAPHKPLLLLSVIDLFAEGSIGENLIPLTPLLHDTFNDYWNRVMPRDRRGNIAMPFFHLTGDRFWHLVPQPGSENVVQSGRRLRSIRLLHDHTAGARLDDVLYDLLASEQPRDVLRRALIEGHFTADVHDALIEQGTLNIESLDTAGSCFSRLEEISASRNPRRDWRCPRRHGIRDSVEPLWMPMITAVQ